MTVEADRIEHVARTAWQTNADFGGHVGKMWRHQTPAVQERWRVIAQAVLDYVEPNEEVKRLESQMRGLRRAYDHACEQRDKYMRRTAEWRSAALDGHEMPEDDAVATLAQVRKIVLDDAALSNEMRMRRIVEALGVDDTRACTGCPGCAGCNR